ncbi:ketopantoate reductase family protein [Sporosarcina soli]|uniref:2-dehydropantoate 2-reductase n=1 Tax=Sporosarcina soli TaxID=334736 RepID=A0ABW0TD08_9BACL
MNIIIAGAGAMGCRFGSALAYSSCQVTLLDNWQEHIHKINRDGLIVTNEKGSSQILIRASLPGNCDHKADLMIFFTKSMQTESMIKSCLHLITEKTEVLTLQNGIGNIEVLSQYISENQLFAGTTTYAANLEGPGTVEAFGSGTIEMMHVKGERKKQTKKIVSILNEAGLRTELSADILKSIWEKAAFNAVLNPLCTLTSSTVGTIGTYGAIVDVVSGILKEVELVAHAENVRLDRQKVMRVIDSVFDPAMSAHHYSSMYHDIQKGRPTEIDFLNGAIIQKAQKHKIAVPYNTLIYHLIKMLENNRIAITT